MAISMVLSPASVNLIRPPGDSYSLAPRCFSSFLIRWDTAASVISNSMPARVRLPCLAVVKKQSNDLKSKT